MKYDDVSRIITPLSRSLERDDELVAATPDEEKRYEAEIRNELNDQSHDDKQKVALL